MEFTHFAREHLTIALAHLVEAQLSMSNVGQPQFDQDLAAYIGKVGAYITAVGAFVAAVNTAAPNLATEDAEVGAASTDLATAQAALPTPPPVVSAS